MKHSLVTFFQAKILHILNALALILICFFAFFCENLSSGGNKTSKSNYSLEYHPSIFVNPFKNIVELDINNITKGEVNSDSTFSVTLGNNFRYVVLRKEAEYWNYTTYLELGSIKYPITQQELPRPGDLLSCLLYKLDGGDQLFFLDYLEADVNSSRPTSKLIIIKLDHTNQYKVLFVGNRINPRKEDFGSHNNEFYFLNDLGRGNIGIYKYDNNFKRDTTRRIVLKDSLGIRFIDESKTNWP